MALIAYLKLEHDTFGVITRSFLGTDPADKTFLWLCIVSNVSKWSNLLLKMGKKLLSLATVLN